MTQVFLTVNGTFPQPSDWTHVNKIECLAAGGAGGPGSGTVGPGSDTGLGGGGGAGGNYAYDTNVPVASWPVTYYVSQSTPTNGNDGLVTGWNCGSNVWTSIIQAKGSVAAGCGISGSTTSGGANPGTRIYPAGNIGGSGATPGVGGAYTFIGGGGGGAAGPNGPGWAPGQGGFQTGLPNGGNPPGGIFSPPEYPYVWDSTHNPGAGGAGGYVPTPGEPVVASPGAPYGGGGGGGCGAGTYSVPQAASGAGLIVVTYTPLITLQFSISDAVDKARGHLSGADEVLSFSISDAVDQAAIELYHGWQRRDLAAPINLPRPVE